MDNFHEEAVRKKNSGLNTVIYILSFLGMVLCGAFTMVNLTPILSGFIDFYGVFLTLVSAALTYGFYMLRNNQRIEYDYTFTNGILDIARITNNIKRKKLLSVNISDFEVIAPIRDSGFRKMLNHKGIKRRYNYFLNRGGGLYYGVFDHDGQKSLIVFEPSRKLLDLFKIYNPRNVKTE